MASKQEAIAQVLDRLTASLGSDISGAVAVAMDGIVLVSRLSNDVNIDRVGAVAATIIGVTRRVAGELRIGTAEEVIIKADRGMFLVLPAGDNNLLAVNLREGSNLGMVRIEARDAATEIGHIL